MYRCYFFLIFSALFHISHAQEQIGLASVRPLAHEGMMTQSNVPFSHDSLVASHRSIPLGKIVRVTNLNNLEFVVVRINDRGPFIKNRILDLSERAAFNIGLDHEDILEVRIEILDDNTLIPSEDYPIQGDVTSSVSLDSVYSEPKAEKQPSVALDEDIELNPENQTPPEIIQTGDANLSTVNKVQSTEIIENKLTIVEDKTLPNESIPTNTLADNNDALAEKIVNASPPESEDLNIDENIKEINTQNTTEALTNDDVKNSSENPITPKKVDKEIGLEDAESVKDTSNIKSIAASNNKNLNSNIKEEKETINALEQESANAITQIQNDSIAEKGRFNNLNNVNSQISVTEDTTEIENTSEIQQDREHLENADALDKVEVSLHETNNKEYTPQDDDTSGEVDDIHISEVDSNKIAVSEGSSEANLKPAKQQNEDQNVIYNIQVGSFKDRDKAYAFSKNLLKEYKIYNLKVKSEQETNTYKVIAGRFTELQYAEAYKNQLINDVSIFDSKSIFVVDNTKNSSLNPAMRRDIAVEEVVENISENKDTVSVEDTKILTDTQQDISTDDTQTETRVDTNLDSSSQTQVELRNSDTSLTHSEIEATTAAADEEKANLKEKIDLKNDSIEANASVLNAIDKTEVDKTQEKQLNRNIDQDINPLTESKNLESTELKSEDKTEIDTSNPIEELRTESLVDSTTKPLETEVDKITVEDQNNLKEDSSVANEIPTTPNQTPNAEDQELKETKTTDTARTQSSNLNQQMVEKEEPKTDKASKENKAIIKGIENNIPKVETINKKGLFTIQVGSFDNRDDAYSYSKELLEKYKIYNLKVKGEVQENTKIYNVVVGRFTQMEYAKVYKDQLVNSVDIFDENTIQIIDNTPKEVSEVKPVTKSEIVDKEEKQSANTEAVEDSESIQSKTMKDSNSEEDINSETEEIENLSTNKDTVSEKTKEFFTIQVGSFSNRENAYTYSKELFENHKIYNLKVKSYKTSASTEYKVVVGRFSDRKYAQVYKEELEKKVEQALIIPLVN